jgi:hypothetical protein
MAWEVYYINWKPLERRCPKWARITHLDIWNISYGQKKGRESNCQYDSRPLKVKNWPNFHACRWRATYRWKALDEGYNFAWNLIFIRGLHVKLWRPKIAGVSTLAISGLPLGSPGTKCHLDVGLWLVLTPKVLQLRTNHLVLVLCRPVWVSEACQFFLVPSQSSSTPLYPSKMLRTKECARLLALPLFSIWDSYLSPSRN